MSNIHSFDSPPRPFTIHYPQSSIDDLNQRLEKTRWPKVDAVPDDLDEQEKQAAFGMGPGPTMQVLKPLVEKWRNDYKWKNTENHFNTFNHYKVEIEGLDIHYLHHPSNRPDAKPLILCHGWPGSFAEFLYIIPYLTTPASTLDQAYHVVVPSLPGFAFSSPPPSSKWTMDDTARVFDKLMTGLGYDRYAAQGGDWGSITARCMGALHSDHCKAVHLNFLPASQDGLINLIPPRTLLAYLPGFIMPALQKMRLYRALDYLDKGSAYYTIQHLTPRTPSVALNDSPVGLLAWIGEKMLPYIDIARQTQNNPTLTLDSLFETLSLYWLTDSIGTSFWPYAQQKHFKEFLNDPKYRLNNMALSTFPNEIVISPLSWIKGTGDLKWYKEHHEGGHFAALELPEVLADHIREALNQIWPNK